MIKVQILALLCVCCLLAFSFRADAASSSQGGAASQTQRAWSMEDSVNAALGYNPSLKQEQEGRKIAEENLNQAKAGHLPQVNAYSATGGRTILVPKR